MDNWYENVDKSTFCGYLFINIAIFCRFLTKNNPPLRWVVFFVIVNSPVEAHYFLTIDEKQADFHARDNCIGILILTSDKANLFTET